MRNKFYALLLIASMIPVGLLAQYKTENPSTYQSLCFYVINKKGFVQYEAVKKAILQKEYKTIYPLLHQMKASLHQFELSKHNRAFEMWYIGNYTDFEQQVLTAKESMLAIVKDYENKLRNKNAVYYDHRMFLEHYLAYTSAYFYADFWFMSMERYFALATVNRVIADNEEGHKLFSNSEFYYPYDVFNDLAKSEENDIKDYLDMNDLIHDTTSFIPYSYVAMHASSASYILQQFELDDATQDVNTDRQVTALRNMLEAVQSGKALLVVRLNLIELRRMEQLKAAAKLEESEAIAD